MRVGDKLKSTYYPDFNGAEIILIQDDKIYLKFKDNHKDSFDVDIIKYEIKKRRMTIVPGKILNWKERIK